VGGVATRVVTGAGRTARVAARVGLARGERRPGAGDRTATPFVDRPAWRDVVGTAVTERETARAGWPVCARVIAGLAARGVSGASRRVVPCPVDCAVGVAEDETAGRAAGTGVVVSGEPARTGVAATVDAAGVRLAGGARGAAAVAVPAASPATPPLPLAPDVASAGVMRAPDLREVTVVAVGPPARRVAGVIVPAAPALEVTVADARALCAAAVARPVAPDRAPKADIGGGVPLSAPVVLTAPGPFPPTAPRARARPVTGVAGDRCNAAGDRATVDDTTVAVVDDTTVAVVDDTTVAVVDDTTIAVVDDTTVAATGGRSAWTMGDERPDGAVITPLPGVVDVVTRRACAEERGVGRAGACVTTTTAATLAARRVRAAILAASPPAPTSDTKDVEAPASVPPAPPAAPLAATTPAPAPPADTPPPAVSTPPAALAVAAWATRSGAALESTAVLSVAGTVNGSARSRVRLSVRPCSRAAQRAHCRACAAARRRSSSRPS